MFRFLVFFYMGLMLLLSHSVYAQGANSKIQSCYANAEARYRCYAARFDVLLNRALERAEQRESILESQAAARLDKEVSPNEISELQREEMRKLIEASRKRNVSHRGEKYSLTYGFVLEPRK